MHSKRVIPLVIKRRVAELSAQNPLWPAEQLVHEILRLHCFQLTEEEIRRILRQREKLLDAPPGQQTVFRLRTAAYPDFEKALAAWYREQLSAGNHVMMDGVIEKAKEIGPTMGVADSFRYSHGWCFKFMARHGFKKAWPDEHPGIASIPPASLSTSLPPNYASSSLSANLVPPAAAMALSATEVSVRIVEVTDDDEVREVPVHEGLVVTMPHEDSQGLGKRDGAEDMEGAQGHLAVEECGMGEGQAPPGEGEGGVLLREPSPVVMELEGGDAALPGPGAAGAGEGGTGAGAVSASLGSATPHGAAGEGAAAAALPPGTPGCTAAEAPASAAAALPLTGRESGAEGGEPGGEGPHRLANAAGTRSTTQPPAAGSAVPTGAPSAGAGAAAATHTATAASADATAPAAAPPSAAAASSQFSPPSVAPSALPPSFGPPSYPWHPASLPVPGSAPASLSAPLSLLGKRGRPRGRPRRATAVPVVLAGGASGGPAAAAAAGLSSSALPLHQAAALAAAGGAGGGAAAGADAQGGAAAGERGAQGAGGVRQAGAEAEALSPPPFPLPARLLEVLDEALDLAVSCRGVVGSQGIAAVAVARAEVERAVAAAQGGVG